MSLFRGPKMRGGALHYPATLTSNRAVWFITSSCRTRPIRRKTAPQLLNGFRVYMGSPRVRASVDGDTKHRPNLITRTSVYEAQKNNAWDMR